MGLPEFIKSPSQKIQDVANGHMLFGLTFGDGLKT